MAWNSLMDGMRYQIIPEINKAISQKNALQKLGYGPTLWETELQIAHFQPRR